MRLDLRLTSVVPSGIAQGELRPDDEKSPGNALTSRGVIEPSGRSDMTNVTALPSQDTSPATVVCRRCGARKPYTVDHFLSEPRSPSGLIDVCLQCMSLAEEERAAREVVHRSVAEWVKVKWEEETPTEEQRAEILRRQALFAATDLARRQRAAFDERMRLYHFRKRQAEGSHTAADVARIYAEQQGLCFYFAAKT